MNLNSLLTKEEKTSKCLKFFSMLSYSLSNTYTAVRSCNKDISMYLVKNGTEDQISYYGKPLLSFRVSDHWNWFSSINKCDNEKYIQCYSTDIPWTRRREEPGKATRPIKAICVCIYGIDNKYHVVYGEKFDRKNKTWSWIESTTEEVIKQYLED